jgi:diguanylate cyclase
MTNPTALVVDDDPNTRTLVQNALTTLGYQSRKARDGYEALELVYRQPPDVIVMDLMMPQMNGFMLLANLRLLLQLFENRKVPVIVLSALADQTKGIERIPGVVGVMCKGRFTLDDFRDMLDRVPAAA